MFITFDTINIVLLFVVFIYIVFLYLIFTKGKNILIKNSYSLVVVSIIFWTLAMIIYRSSSENSNLFWCKVLYVTATVIPTSFFIFSIIFPYAKIPRFRSWIIVIFSNIAIILLVIASNLIIKGVDVTSGEEKKILWGHLYILYSLYISSFFLLGLIVLFKKYLKEYGRIKNQIKFVFWGCFTGSNLAMITNMLMVSWGDFRLNWLGQVLSIVMVAFTVYAIIAHRLMDIKFVMRRYSVNLTAMAFVLLPLLLFRFLINEYFPDFSTFFEFILLFSAVAFFPVVKNWTYHLANKFFFSSLYDPTQVITEISDKLRSTLNINQIYSYIYDTLNGALHIKSFGILRYHRDRKVFSTEFNINFNIGRRVKFERNKYLQDTFTKKNKPIIIEEVKREHYNNKTKELIDIMEGMKVEMLYPLIVKNRIVGLMVLGMKETADMYTDEDLQILKIIASQSAIAIENAMLYEETKNFSERMEKEVKIATADLRAANEKLKKLDAAKSEFISIASHQLRTPLTVIKGYISMMTEGSFGELSDPIKDSLSKVYESNERLISLVENLLNISRIESGRLKFSFEVVQLEDMVVSVCEELLGTAKEKNIKLEFRKPKHALAKVKIDTEKIRQVIMNLIDNAVKYTDKGEVIVSLKREKDSLLFCVKDNGLGIPSQDLPHLFKKFARGKNAMLTHTEGTGLGLFVAKQMIEFHKGKIWAESEGENKGAKFCFLLPIVEIEKG